MSSHYRCRLTPMPAVMLLVTMLLVIVAPAHAQENPIQKEPESAPSEPEKSDDYTRARAADKSDSKQKRTEAEEREVVYQKQVMLSEGELSNRIRKASEVLSRATSGSDPLLGRALLNEAQCIAVFPNITTAAAVIGGYHGDGIVTCKGPQDRYSALGFVDLTGGSIGAQLGVKTSDLILLFMSDKARQAIEEGRIELGADASVAFGGSNELAEVSTDRADVRAFSSSAGLFAGAGLRGTSLAADKSELEEFYAENATYQRVITAYNIPDHPLVVRDFIKLMSEEELEEQLEGRQE